jgi:hypothetical protein
MSIINYRGTEERTRATTRRLLRSRRQRRSLTGIRSVSMNMRILRRRTTICVTLAGAIGLVAGCGSDDGGGAAAPAGTSGGQIAAAGTSGGPAETGGAQAGRAAGGTSGGAVATGGTAVAGGGNGGVALSGGSPATGGAAGTSGTPESGGTPASGGTAGTAGTPESGGTPTSGGTAPAQGGSGGTATACGNLGEPCCAGDLCTAAASSCRALAGGSNVCSPCGGPGETCCGVTASQPSCTQGGCCIANVCIASGSSCGDQEGLCQAGACENCGGDGQACCGTGTCADWHECAAGDGGDVCRHCGADGESCCTNTLSPRCAAGVVCVNSSGTLSSECHATCGAVGQPCCTVTGTGNNGCNETGGLTCTSDTCVEPGGAGGAGAGGSAPVAGAGGSGGMAACPANITSGDTCVSGTDTTCHRTSSAGPDSDRTCVCGSNDQWACTFDSGGTGPA